MSRLILVQGGTVYMLFVWAGIALVIAITAAVVGFTHMAPGASEEARMVFYLILALSLLLLLIGFIVVRKVTSFARGFGINLSVGGLLGMMKWVQLLRMGRRGFRR
jgi:uncharacterized membrane protein YtjA (UPF0391 family)